MGAERRKKVQFWEDFPKLKLDFNLFKSRNSHLIYRGCPRDSLTIGHCPPELVFLSDILSGVTANDRTFGILYRTMSEI